MTAGSEGILRVYPATTPQSAATIAGTLLHETGHVLSMRQFGDDNAAPGWNRWRDAAASDGLRPSQYAKNNLDEDFAESMALYGLVKGTPEEASVRAMLPGRFSVLDELTGSAR
jgi:hypothetical protein